MRQSRAGMGTGTNSSHSMAGRAQPWQDERGPSDRTSRQWPQAGLPGAKAYGGVSGLTLEHE